MSKTARKHSPHKRQRTGDRVPSVSKGQNKELVVFAVIAVLAAIPFVLGKYFEFNSPGAYDSGGYVYSAEKILRGARMGIDEQPSAQMGTLLVNMLGVWVFGFSETGPKLIQGLLQAAALVLMFVAIRKLFGTLAAAVGVILASVYLSAPLIAKFGNVKEQHMIAFMVLAVSSLVLRQLGGKWWWAVLAGACAIWAPMFKQTGLSAAGAMGLFIIVQPILKHRNWKQTGTDILLLAAGAAIGLGPVYLWLATEKAAVGYWPYSFLWRPIFSSSASPPQNTEEKPAEAKKENEAQGNPANEDTLLRFLPGYVRESWEALEPEERAKVAHRIFSYYRLLILPIALAIGAIIIRIIRMILRRPGKSQAGAKTARDRFVFLFAVWWLLDMAFVWISPRSYEQYYLPLNASAAMLGGYLIATYTERLTSSGYKIQWRIVGLVGLIFMIAMSGHIFFGIERSPHSGVTYKNQVTGEPERRRGYVQKWREVANRKKGAIGYWEHLGRHIRDNSVPSDTIYVWGWWPGIYVQAQRLSSSPKAFEGTMHTLSPEMLSARVAEILGAFEEQPPKFIVDTHKSHFPWDRPPLELWPRTRNGFLPAGNNQIIERYDTAYANMLREKIEPDEALRYEAMKPFRQYVMGKYRIVNMQFGQHVLFERK